MPLAQEPDDASRQVAELEKRHAALRQAASLPAADLGAVLDAAFTELEGAIGLLAGPSASSGQAVGGRSQDPDGAERRLLRAAFSDVPVPLFLLARDGTVVRVNKSAAELLGSKPGYATGRPFTAFVALPEPGRGGDEAQRGGQERQRRPGQMRPARFGRGRAQGAGHRIGPRQR